MLKTETRNKSEGEKGVCCLRRQRILELHTGHIVIQGHRQHLLHGTDEAVLLTAVLNHQRVGFVRVKHDVVRGYNHHSSHNSLQRSQKPPLKLKCVFSASWKSLWYVKMHHKWLEAHWSEVIGTVIHRVMHFK